MFSRESYVSLMGDLTGAGYSFRFFDSYEDEGCVLLRHDVDFSLQDAAELAELERQQGITATYFILLSSEFYNVSTPGSRSCIERIASTGARLALHFDPTAYSDLDEGLELERAQFESLCQVPLTIVSLHRPRDFLTDNNRKLAGVRHTYEDSYFKDLKYVSDSGGSFGYGHPLDTEEFKAGRSIHLNLHPIWWTREGDTPSEKLRSWLCEHFGLLTDEAARNCRTFDGNVTFVADPKR